MKPKVQTRSENSRVEEIYEMLVAINDTLNFVDDFVSEYGFPLWQAAMGRNSDSDEDYLISIPVLFLDSMSLSGLFVCSRQQNNLWIEFRSTQELRHFIDNVDTEPDWHNAVPLTLLTINAEVGLFGSTSKRYFHFLSVKESNLGDESLVSRGGFIQIRICIVVPEGSIDVPGAYVPAWLEALGYPYIPMSEWKPLPEWEELIGTVITQEQYQEAVDYYNYAAGFLQDSTHTEHIPTMEIVCDYYWVPVGGDPFDYYLPVPIGGQGSGGGRTTYWPGRYFPRIENCDGFFDPYDTGSGNPTSGYPDSAFCLQLFDLRECLDTIGNDKDMVDWYLWYDDDHDPEAYDGMVDFACTNKLPKELKITAINWFREHAFAALMSWRDYAAALWAIQRLYLNGVEIDPDELICLLEQPFSSIELDDYVTNEINSDPTLEDDVIEFADAAIDLLCTEPQVKMARMIQLNELIKSNPYALISDCISQNPNINLNDYHDLYNFDIPPIVQEYLESLGNGFQNQPIEDGNVAVTNVDDFSVEITALPDLDNDGYPESMQETWNSLRLAFMEVASGTAENFEFSCNNPFGPEIADISWSFIPYSPISEAKWYSSDPVNTIFVIPTSVSEPTLNFASDHGAVIVSQHSDCCWINSSIITPSSSTQPFSGNRQFGYRVNSAGNMEVYTKAIDIARRSPRVIFAPSSKKCETRTYYDIAIATWENFQSEIKQYVEQRNGVASINPVQQALYNNDIIINLLKSTDPVEFVPCD